MQAETSNVQQHAEPRFNLEERLLQRCQLALVPKIGPILQETEELTKIFEVSIRTAEKNSK